MTTLEARVEQRLAEFTLAAQGVPSKRQEVARMETALAAIDPLRDATRHYDAARALRLAREELTRLESRDDEIQYLLDIAPFVKEYDTVLAVENSKGTSLLDAFVCVTHKSSKNQVLQKYLAEVEKQHDAMPCGKEARLVEVEHTCEACNANMVINHRESALVCMQCGLSRDFMEMSEANLSYEQEVTTDVINYFAYKRLNHFTEWLNSLQAKENTDIPPEIAEAVKAEFKKARTTTRGEIKPAKVREYLKKLKLNKYYEHTHSICNVLNGVPAPKVSQALEARLKHMFVEIQAPFAKHCPALRKNFLSYGYTLYKFCELLGEEIEDIRFSQFKMPGVVDKIGDGTVGALNKVKQDLQNVQRELDDARGTLDNVKNFITNFPNLIKNEFDKIIDKVKDIVNDALKDIKAAFAWVGKVKEFWDKFKGWIISATCTVVILCFVALVGPVLMPVITFLTTLRSTGTTLANSMAPAS